MEVDALRKFALIDEVCVQASFAVDAYSKAQAVWRSENKQDWQARELWVHLQQFLIHAGLLSKFFWPILDSRRKAEQSNQRKENRATYLKVQLNIEEGSALESRSARDSLEHFDERLDNWLFAEKGALIEHVFQNRSGFDFMFACGRNRLRRGFIVDELVLLTPSRDDGIDETNVNDIFLAVNRIRLRAVCLLESGSFEGCGVMRV